MEDNRRKAEWIRKDLPLKSQVRITLTDRSSVSGVVLDINDLCITLLTSGQKPARFFYPAIDGWIRLDQTYSGAVEIIPSSPTMPGAGNAPVSPVPPFPLGYSADVLPVLIEIEVDYRKQIESAKIKVPRFDFPPSIDELGATSRASASQWQSIAQRYRYAEKNNLLKDRVGLIAKDLEDLVKQHPRLLILRQHLGYLCYLWGRPEKALIWYEDVVAQSKEAQDWLALAASALETAQEALAFCCLEEVFKQTKIDEHLDAWFVYARLIRTFTNYACLSSLVEKRALDVSENELDVLFKTGIFLLTDYHGKDKAKVAPFVERWDRERDRLAILKEMFAQFDAAPASEYQEFLKQWTGPTGRKRWPGSANASSSSITRSGQLTKVML